MGGVVTQHEAEVLVNLHLKKAIEELTSEFHARVRACAHPGCKEWFVRGLGYSGKNAVYCSGEHAGEAQRKAKRDWWNTYGEEWRKQRAIEVGR
jgi:predicted RNA-binding Zn ribbon-like protein